MTCEIRMSQTKSDEKMINKKPLIKSDKKSDNYNIQCEKKKNPSAVSSNKSIYHLQEHRGLHEDPITKISDTVSAFASDTIIDVNKFHLGK